MQKTESRQPKAESRKLIYTTIKVFRTLRYRNFRLFFIGQSVSLIGTWMQQVAMYWLVYRISNSPLLLGIVGFSSQIPAFILSPFTGVFVDRANKHRIIMVTQILSMLQAVIFVVLIYSGHISIWHIVVLGIFLGCVNSFDIPARQAFLVEMVAKKEDLSNAIPLNSLMFNAARLIGPSIAGIVIAVANEGVCFLINAISFLGVIIALALMDVKPKKIDLGKAKIFETLKEGFAYAFGFVPIRLILFLLAIVSLMGASYIVLMPVFAKDILGGGASTLGFLMASGSAGAVFATLYIASRSSVLGLGRMIPISSSLFSIGLILFSFCRIYWLSLVLLAVTGFGMMVHMAASNIILQTIVDDDKRGRIMSLYTMAFIGTVPVGSLFAGALASRIGATATLTIGGVTCLLGSIIFAVNLPIIKKMIHPIYKRIGVIKEVASGLGAATTLSVPTEE